MKKHVLASGLVVGITSAHDFRFSDGTFCPVGATKEFVGSLTTTRDFRVVKETPFRATRSTQSLNSDQLGILEKVSGEVDIVLVSFMLLSSLYSMGARDRFPKVVAFNATTETARSAPADKVVDVNNWAW